jgi:lipopolysaccharide export system permease protein
MGIDSPSSCQEALMRIYERYLARAIYLNFSIVLLILSGLFFFFDLIRELDSIGQAQYRFSHALIRVGLRLPLHCYDLIPVAALISVIYVLATLAAHSEYTILRVSGVSTRRILFSLLKIAAPLVFVILLLGEVAMPYTTQVLERLQAGATGKSMPRNFQSGRWFKDTLADDHAGQPVVRFINIGALMPDETIRNIRIYELTGYQLTTILTAQYGVFIAPDRWQLSHVTATQLSRKQAQTGSPYRAIQKTMAEYSIHSQITPQQLTIRLVPPHEMPILRLLSYLRYLKQNRQDAQRYQIGLWQKLIYPTSVLVMFVLALPFAYLQPRASAVGVKVTGGMLLGISFQFIIALFSYIGVLYRWPAPLAAAAPAMIYCLLGMMMVRWVSRLK